MSEKSFAQTFCESFGVPPERFVDAMLDRALYPHARFFLVPLCAGFRFRWLKPDREILSDLGRACDLGDVRRLLSRLPWYYGRTWSFRHELRLRLSSRRILDVARRIGLRKPNADSSRKAESARLGEAVRAVR